MHLLILEDDLDDRTLLLNFAERFARETGCAVECFAAASPEEVPEDMTHYSAALLDIMIDGKPTGIDLARALRAGGWKGNFAFITSSDDYYPQGFEMNAVHYLLKPLSYADFAEAMERILRASGHRRRTVQFPVGRSHISVPLDSILFAEVYGRTTLLHLHGQTLTALLPLRDVAALLLDNGNFLQCFRSYVVNLSKVERLEDDSFLMKDGSRIPIALRSRQSIKEAYLAYRVNTLKGGADEVD